MQFTGRPLRLLVLLVVIGVVSAGCVEENTLKTENNECVCKLGFKGPICGTNYLPKTVLQEILSQWWFYIILVMSLGNGFMTCSKMSPIAKNESDPGRVYRVATAIFAATSPLSMMTLIMGWWHFCQDKTWSFGFLWCLFLPYTTGLLGAMSLALLPGTTVIRSPTILRWLAGTPFILFEEPTRVRISILYFVGFIMATASVLLSALLFYVATSQQYNLYLSLFTSSLYWGFWVGYTVSSTVVAGGIGVMFIKSLYTKYDLPAERKQAQVFKYQVFQLFLALEANAEPFGIDGDDNDSERDLEGGSDSDSYSESESERREREERARRLRLRQREHELLGGSGPTGSQSMAGPGISAAREAEIQLSVSSGLERLQREREAEEEEEARLAIPGPANPFAEAVPGGEVDHFAIGCSDSETDSFEIRGEREAGFMGQD
ncbi:hypothetical protein KIPB_004453 [Kipferlia bialata]|uniref:EGF-like domain-containing protein n=1 Tax=Kipferlia bialata TaxID=797122 RepID=A0A9K3CTU0_9EUKA|nr:hypothetical protein KIPB_004453 [Kipferlia bialata]|eukprot:g4453.t1